MNNVQLNFLWWSELSHLFRLADPNYPEFIFQFEKTVDKGVSVKNTVSH